ncbi:MAG: hypothetical protein RI923_994 [Pseudomonadota bacterium]|jgi:outer membrane receptor protein involved in Fe transport
MKTHKNIRPKLRVSRLPLTAAIYMALSTAALAVPDDQAAEEKKATLDTVTVTAQKRTENLQEVPISIQVLGEQKLEEMNVADFDDYAKLLPSVSFTKGEGGSSTPYFRGVVSGGDGNHSASQPSVGVYLDEQSVTTIGGVLDMHIYDVERIEALAGPQGTLYGASSQSGTLKIISNKPDSSGFSAGYGLEANSLSGGGNGFVTEGYVNIPISESAAIRIVAWDKYDAGYIDNIYQSRYYPTADMTVDNAGMEAEDYNDIRTVGARAALKIDLGDNWSVMPTIMAQSQTTNGNFGFDDELGEFKIAHGLPEFSEDNWMQAALTVQGKVGALDIVYNGAYLDRDVDGSFDYSDYGFWYDVAYGYANYNDLGDAIDPSQTNLSNSNYKKYSHELRVSSDQDKRFRFVGGVFFQKQTHDIQERYVIDGLAADSSVTGWDDTIWLTKQVRQDKDEAVFGEMTYDITQQLSLTAGMRFYSYDNTLEGFRGYKSSEASCIDPAPFQTAPCLRFTGRAKESGNLGKLNLTYTLNDDALVYFTWSEGYRPGGVNRVANTGPYLEDKLENIELGWKTSWRDNSVIFNGALFMQSWDDFQFSTIEFTQGEEIGLTLIKNAASAEINGLEMDLSWAATYNLNLSAGVAFYDSKLSENFCGWNTANGPETNCPAGSLDPEGNVVAGPQAPEGTRLPITPKYKGNINARYTFDVAGMESYVQGTAYFESDRQSALLPDDAAVYGEFPSYGLFDFSTGIRKDSWSLDLFVKNVFDKLVVQDRYSQCGTCQTTGLVPEYPNGQVYTIASPPRTIGLRFSQEF